MTASALRVLDGGGAPRGWEQLWAKDQWRQGELPHGDLASLYRGETIVHFEHLRQPWLKEAAKRWARTRLLGASSPRTMSSSSPICGRSASGWIATAGSPRRRY